MKKRWLALGLATIMSVGCLVACGDGKGTNGNEGDTDIHTTGGNNSNGEGIKGERVTAEQWATAFANVDKKYSCEEYYTKSVTWQEEEVVQSREVTGSYTFYENNTYVRTSEKELRGGVERIRDTEQWYTIINESLYTYGNNERQTELEGEWIVRDVVRNFSGVDTFARMWEDNAMEDFTFDEVSGVYTLQLDVAMPSYTIGVKGEGTSSYSVIFVNGTLYSFSQEVIRGEEGKDINIDKMGITFKKQTIELPDQDGLNALIASNQ